MMVRSIADESVYLAAPVAGIESVTHDVIKRF